MVKRQWFKTYTEAESRNGFDWRFQSWDTANKAGELNDYSVCTTWGVQRKNLYLLNVLRKRMEYPELKRAVWSQCEAFNPRYVLIEDKSSGTPLIQELIRERFRSVKPYQSKLDKVMRMHSATSTIESGFVHLPEQAHWLQDYLAEVTNFPHSKHDDQVDSTSQALDWHRSLSNHYVRVYPVEF